MQYATHSLSRTGGRSQNQDRISNCILDTGQGCWVLADGLGGHGGGEVASAIAVDTIMQRFAQHPEVSGAQVEALIQSAQDALHEHQQAHSQLMGMRTTIVVLTMENDKAFWGHVGDSRLYVFRNRSKVVQTIDHSVPQTMVAAGELQAEEIRFHHDRNKLIYSLGQKEYIRISHLDEPFAVQKGDVFLLCTDGFWEFVSEVEMEADLAKSNTLGDWLRYMEDRLLLRAEENHDNYSAIVVAVN